MLLKLSGGEDPNVYKTLVMENGMKVVLSSHPKACKGAAALAVKAGGFSDPESAPGMAHFLEHMLFMGTEEHPKEDYYANYISAHGGYYNAYTANEVTNYHYDISAKHLKESLEVFSGFFKCPLIMEDALERERLAVDSEHEKNILSELWRSYHLLTLLSVAESPMSKFQTGSLRTLKHVKRQELVDFWEEIYHPERMCLMVHGRDSLEELEGYVREYFGSVADRCPPSKRAKASSLYVPPLTGQGSQPYYSFKEEVANKVVMYRPAIKLNTEQSKLTITITLPETISTYRSKTMNYLTILLEGSGENSMANLLMLAGVASKIHIGFDQTTINTLLMIEIDLIGDNPAHLGVIADLLEEYLKMVREHCSEALYEMCKKVAELEFEVLEVKQPLQQVSCGAYNMCFYPMEEFKKYDYRWDGWNREECLAYLDIALERSKWVLLYRTSSLDEEEGLIVDEIFGINYQIRDIPAADAELSASLRRQLVWSFALAGEVDLGAVRGSSLGVSIGVIPVGVQALPKPEEEVWNTKVEKPGLTAYLVHTKRFNVKDAQVIVSLETREHLETAKRYTAFIGYMNGFMQFFQQKYRAELLASQVKVVQYTSLFRVNFRFEGPPLLIENLIGTFFAEYTTKDTKFVNMARNSAVLHFQGLLKLEPYRSIDHGLRIACGYPTYQSHACLKLAERLRAEDLFTVTKAQVSLLASGNLTEDEFQRVIATVEKHVKVGTASSLLQPAAPKVLVHTENPKNIAVSLVHLIDEFSPVKSMAMARLLSITREQAFFQQVRTEETYGYIVYLESAVFFKTPVVRLVVQTQRPFEEVEARIKRFIQQVPGEIAKLSAADYQTFQQGAITQATEEAHNLTGYLGGLFHNWCCHEFQLDYKEALAREIAAISQAELVAYAKKLVHATTVHVANFKGNKELNGFNLISGPVEISFSS